MTTNQTKNQQSPSQSVNQLSPEEIPLFLFRCIKALLGNDLDRAREKNDVGFNRFDGDRARELAATYPDWKGWTTVNAWTMLQKYRRQLAANHCIDFAVCPKPENPPPVQKPIWQPRPKQPNTVDVQGSLIVIKPEYSESLNHLLRSRLVGKTWEGEEKAHTAPLTPHNIAAALEIVQAFPWLKLTEAAEAAFNTAAAKAEANVKASTQEEADYQMSPGFGREPFPFQRAGIAQGVTQQKTLLFDDMGLGKTMQTLGIIHELKLYPALVIVPPNLLWNWAREICAALPDDISVGVINGTKLATKPSPAQKRLKFPANAEAIKADIVVIGYSVLAAQWDKQSGRGKRVILTEIAQALKERNLKVVALDESHYIKNDDAQRTRACYQLREGVEHRIIASGSPIENRPEELVSQLTFAGLIDQFGGAWQFKLRYCDAKKERIFMRGGAKEVWNTKGASNLQELNQRLKEIGMIRRRKAQVLKELPPKQRIRVDLDLDNWAEYNAAEAEVARFAQNLALENDKRFLAWLKERGTPCESIKAAQQLPDYEALRQQYGNKAYTAAQQTEALAKFNVLKQIASRGMRAAAEEWLTNFMEQKQKAIIFASFQETQEHYFEFMKQFGATNVFGSTPGNERDKNIQAFREDPAVRGIVMSLWAAAEGVNLQTAQDVIFPELPWNPSKRNQAEDRVHRIGQTEQCTMYYLIVPGTIYEEIYNLIEDKAAVVDAAMDGTTNNMSSSTLSQLIEKYRSK